MLPSPQCTHCQCYLGVLSLCGLGSAVTQPTSEFFHRARRVPLKRFKFYCWYLRILLPLYGNLLSEFERKKTCRSSQQHTRCLLWLSKQDPGVRSCLLCMFSTPCPVPFVFATDSTNRREQSGPRHVAFSCSRLTWVVATFLIRCV